MEIENIPDGSKIESMSLEEDSDSIRITLRLPNGRAAECVVSMGTLMDAGGEKDIEDILRETIQTKRIDWEKRLERVWFSMVSRGEWIPYTDTGTAINMGKYGYYKKNKPSITNWKKRLEDWSLYINISETFI